MSVDFRNRRNVGIFAGILVVTIVLVVLGTGWLRNNGFNLVGEVAFIFLVLVLAIYTYDRILVR